MSSKIRCNQCFKIMGIEETGQCLCGNVTVEVGHFTYKEQYGVTEFAGENTIQLTFPAKDYQKENVELRSSLQNVMNRLNHMMIAMEIVPCYRCTCSVGKSWHIQGNKILCGYCNM